MRPTRNDGWAGGLNARAAPAEAEDRLLARAAPTEAQDRLLARAAPAEAQDRLLALGAPREASERAHTRPATSAETPERAHEPPVTSGEAPEQLLARLRLDDVTALDGALRLYWRPVLGYLTRWLGSADTAEDVAQRTFVRLWERRREWRLDGSLRGLLFRVARNLAISDQRNLRARERAQERFARAESFGGRGVLERLEDRQLGTALEGAIQQLPERRREVFVLRCVHGFSHREIAVMMGISEQTVANQLNRALSTLRQLLADVLD